MVFGLVGSMGANAITFTAIPPLPGDSEVEFHYLSENGQAVIGFSSPSFDWPNDEIVKRAFYWSVETGTVEIPKVSGTTVVSLTQISFDGTVVSGTSYVPGSIGSARAFRWTPSGGTQTLGSLFIGGEFTQTTTAFGMSADGSVIVGLARDGARPFRWTVSGGIQDLGILGELSNSVFIPVTSKTGSVVAFTSYRKFHDGSIAHPLPARWSIGGGLESLENRSVGYWVTGIGEDGSKIKADYGYWDALTWAGPSTEQVGFNPPYGYPWRDQRKSTDGSIALQSKIAPGSANIAVAVTVNDANGTFHTLQDVLRGARVAIDDWQLSPSAQISVDGTVIAGNGRDPAGNRIAYIVTDYDPTNVEPLPPPSSGPGLPPDLDELPGSERSVEPAGQAKNVLAFSPNGSLGMLLTEWDIAAVDDFDSAARYQLIFRERGPDGTTFADEVVVYPKEDDGYSAFRDASLFYDDVGDPHAYVLHGFYLSHRARINGVWEQVELVVPDFAFFPEEALFDAMAAAQGRDGSIHFAFYNEPLPGPASQVITDPGIVYAKRDSDGGWTWEIVTDPNQPISHFSTWDAYDPVELDHVRQPRNLSIAVDAAGNAHIVFSHDRETTAISGGTEARSSLYHTTNVSGTWTTSTVVSPGSGFGDYGGLGASVAAAPDGTVAVAASIIPRAQTGSPGVAALLYLTRLANGTWSQETVASKSSNYRMGDGERGTGLNPILTFDRNSRPHLVFTDHASQHYTVQGAISFSGQVRYATRASARSGPWDVRLVVSANGASPFDFRTFEPTVTADEKPAVAAVAYRWDESIGKYRRALHVLETLTDLSLPDPAETTPPELDKAKLARNGKTLKLSGTSLDDIKKIKVAGAKVKSFKVRGGKRLIIKFAKPPKRRKMTIRVITDDNKRLTFRVKS